MKHTNKHTGNGLGWLKGLVIMSLLCSVFAASGSLAQESAPTAGSGETASIATVNINTADAETLARTLEGIGESKARAIVAWREANGAFSSVDQLTEVKGIGQATVEKNRAKLSL